MGSLGIRLLILVMVLDICVLIFCEVSIVLVNICGSRCELLDEMMGSLGIRLLILVMVLDICVLIVLVVLEYLFGFLLLKVLGSRLVLVCLLEEFSFRFRLV